MMMMIILISMIIILLLIIATIFIIYHSDNCNFFFFNLLLSWTLLTLCFSVVVVFVVVGLVVVQCHKKYVPVCGSNGDTYQNECFRRQASCKQQRIISRVANGPCSDGQAWLCATYRIHRNSTLLWTIKYINCSIYSFSSQILAQVLEIQMVCL